MSECLGGKLGIRPCPEAHPMGSLRPYQGISCAFIGIVEAPDETSALKTAIEEFGIINPEHQNRLFVRRVPSDDD